MATTTGTRGTTTRPGGEGRPVAVTTDVEHDAEHAEGAAVHAVHETARALEAIRDELPRHSWPVVVGATGLVLTGIIDVPAAVGLTALYLAARHWPFPHPEMADPVR
jgi:hypothetical protein